MPESAAYPEPDRADGTTARALSRSRSAGLSLTALLALLTGLSCLSARIPESGSRQRVLFYAAPTQLAPGARLDPDDLEARLKRLDYHFVEEPKAPGEVQLRPGGGTIWLRPFHYPGRAFPGGRVRLRLGSGEVVSVEPLDPMEAGDLRLEPERIAGFEGDRGAVLKPITLQDAPPLLVQAIIASEDRRFYQHIGIDPLGLVRAFFANLRKQDVGQGGSTLTQQLARSLYLRNQKTIGRKISEAAIAIGLEIRYSKEEILEGYLNAVYWGHWGPMEIRGAREAAQYYLGTDIDQADVAGIALLVGILPAPNAFSPYGHPDRAKRRRDVVLRVLETRGILTAEEAAKARARPIPERRPPVRLSEASYFLDAARVEIERRAPKGIADRPGTKIFTTLDFRDQAAVVASIEKGLPDLEKAHRKLRRKDHILQGAVVSIDPGSGAVRALVGGRDFLRYPFNRAAEARRQPGSLFKPFVFLAAFRRAERRDGSSWTPATVIVDEPVESKPGRKPWPQNYDHEYRGPVTIRQALEQSINAPTARVAVEVGLPRVAAAAQDLGILSPLRPVPSLSLGSSEVTLMEITGAYAALAEGGVAHAPHLVTGILDRDGGVVPLQPLVDPPGVGRSEAFLTTRLLQGVMESGTGKRARALGVRGDVAGKTGTTDDYRDAWFVGFTPVRAIGVWIGFDDNHPVGLSGGAAALPIWAHAMRSAQGRHGDGSFHRPRGVVRVPICIESGQVATADCPSFLEEDFLAGTEPTESCELHAPGLFERFWRRFDWRD